MEFLEQQQSTVGRFPAGLEYVAFAAFRTVGSAIRLPRERRPYLAAEALETLATSPGVALRGTYDASGFRAEANLMIWLAADEPDQLQNAIAAFAQSRLGHTLVPFWSAIGAHRRPEFPQLVEPAYFRGEVARGYVCVSAMAHLPEWYLLDMHTRRRLMLAHARACRDYPEVRPSMVSAFGLGDPDWLLALEGDDLGKVIDLVRHLKGTEMRRHVQPAERFVTGTRRPLREILDALP